MDLLCLLSFTGSLEHFLNSWKIKLLENAIHPLPAFCMVKDQADQHKVQFGKALSYNEYQKLVYSTVVNYATGLPLRLP